MRSSVDFPYRQTDGCFDFRAACCKNIDNKDNSVVPEGTNFISRLRFLTDADEIF